MNITVRAIVSILTLLTVIALVYFVVLGFMIKQPMLIVVCALLTVGFGYFTFNDVKYWWNFFFPKK